MKATARGKPARILIVVAAAMLIAACAGIETAPTASDALACARMAADGARPVATVRTARFLGKVDADTARCRGGERAVAARASSYVDWPAYWAAAGVSSLAGDANADDRSIADARGIRGALADLEYQRIELIRFNLFDNSGTYRKYVEGRDGAAGSAHKVWDEMRLPPTHPAYDAVGGAGNQLCGGELIRFRNVDGICNDLRNPRMGATNELFARNVQFEATFPELGRNELARNRHAADVGHVHATIDEDVLRSLLRRDRKQEEVAEADAIHPHAQHVGGGSGALRGFAHGHIPRCTRPKSTWKCRSLPVSPFISPIDSAYARWRASRALPSSPVIRFAMAKRTRGGP